MLFIRQFLALLVAFQIVNPICACTTMPEGDACHETSAETNQATTSTDPSQSSCCTSMNEDQNSSSSSDQEKDPSQDEDNHLCMCPSSPNTSQETKVDLPDGPELIDLPKLFITELPDPLKDQPLVRQLSELAPYSPRISIRVIYSVFRL